MKTAIFLSAAALTLVGSAAAAQPYGYGYGDRYERHAYRDSDRDGIPDRREWNRDRDHDGRPDQYDRYDNRRDHHRHWRGARSYYSQPGYGYGYGYGSRDRYDGRYAPYPYRRW
ncbi:hypothetical protein [Phenylobacterium sp.]|jgi:hypothetical protein|uniref:hypothetical protein n=1 Tax=Phenylobacterium sp. TaxID=1871053 RepID=UPI002F424D5B